MEKTGLDKMRAAAVAKREQRISQGLTATQNPMEKLADNPTSLRLSVNAKCYECNGGENHISRTRFCVISACPLWEVRPYSKGITWEQCIEYEERAYERSKIGEDEE